MENKNISYVANKDYTKFELTSAAELQDKLQEVAQAAYLFYLDKYVDIQFSIGRIIV